MTYLDALLCKYIYISIDHLIKYRLNNATIFLLLQRAYTLLVGQQLWSNNNHSIDQELLSNNNAPLLDLSNNCVPDNLLKFQPKG